MISGHAPEPSLWVLQLIRRYRKQVKQVVGELQTQSGTDDLLCAVASRRFPRVGKLGVDEEYRFHGVGCEVTMNGITVDFDFGPEHRYDGFDAWRMHGFAENYPEFAQLCTLSALEEELQRMETSGLIHSPRWNPSPHLKYLTDAGNELLGRLEKAELES